MHLESPARTMRTLTLVAGWTKFCYFLSFSFIFYQPCLPGSGDSRGRRAESDEAFRNYVRDASSGMATGKCQRCIRMRAPRFGVGGFLTPGRGGHRLEVRARSSVVEQPAHNRLVAGSIPAGPTSFEFLLSVPIVTLYARIINSPRANTGGRIPAAHEHQPVPAGQVDRVGPTSGSRDCQWGMGDIGGDCVAVLAVLRKFRRVLDGAAKPVRPGDGGGAYGREAEQGCGVFSGG